MSSGYAPLWKRLLFKTPLYKKGLICGNYHFITDRFCYCCMNEYSENWNGGVYDFYAKKERENK